MPIMPQTRPAFGLVAGLILLTGIRFAFAAKIHLTEDEAYYRLWGLFPSYAYFDHAPMTGWWVAIGQRIFGDTYFGLRFLSPVAGFLGSLVLWRMAMRIYGAHIADLAVLIFNAMLLVGVGNVMMTPDIPSVFFWAIALWTLIEWKYSGHLSWWYGFGFAAGLGLLSKYTNGFLGAGVLLWLVLSGYWRALIRAPQFWFAGILALFLFSPVVYWNMQHDWASFAKQLGRLQPHDPTLIFLGEWITGQILLITPALFIFVALAFVNYGKTWPPAQSDAALLMITTWPLLGYFLYHVFSSRINANWTAPIFLNFSLLAAPVLADYSAHISIGRWATKLAIPFGFLMSFAVLADAAFAIFPATRLNPLTQIRGYSDLAADVEEASRRAGAIAIVTSQYQTAALLSYELKNKFPVFQLNERIRYFNMPQPDPVLLKGRVLYIANQREADGFINSARPCFQDAAPFGTLERRDRGLVVAAYTVWVIDIVQPDFIARSRPEDCKSTAVE